MNMKLSRSRAAGATIGAAELRGSAIRRVARMILAGSLLAAVAALAVPGVALATPDHTGCSAVAVGQTSGWCGLYPGNAVDNVKELGQVLVSSDGLSLTIQTQDMTTGAAPATSFACLTADDSAAATHRLQATQCADSGGAWLPFTGGALTIDLTAYPQFLDAQFTAQVAAGQNAENANGDAFYNNFSVSTLTGGIPG